MTNLETTDQFRAAHRRWLKEENKDTGPSMTVTARSRGPSMVARIDADGDTVMAPTDTNGDRGRNHGSRKNLSGKQRAKWVDAAEREKRREKKLCFRCGGSGHRIRECPYEPAMRPAAINAVIAQPMLEDDTYGSDSASSRTGKE